jgi:hypothetical protein
MFSLDANSRDTGLDDSQFTRRGRAKINDAASDKWTAIGDAHVDASVVSKVGDAGYGAKRETSMGGRQLLRIESLAAGGFPAFEAFAVPRRHARLNEIRFLFLFMRLRGSILFRDPATAGNRGD